MSQIVRETATQHTPESLVRRLGDGRGVVLLRSALFDSPHARYSFVAADPFLTFRSFGSRCEIDSPVADDVRRRTGSQSASAYPPPHVGGYVQFGNPWQLLDALMSRCELLDEVDLPFPLGGCFGYWGYDLKNFTEPKLPRRAVNDLELPDCHVGFYDSLVVFDHRLGKTWIVSTGLQPDGSHSEVRAKEQFDFWNKLLGDSEQTQLEEPTPDPSQEGNTARRAHNLVPLLGGVRGGSSDQSDTRPAPEIKSNLSRAEFIAAVERAQRYIRAGDIYQVNLSHRIAAPCPFDGWELFNRLLDVSPAPFAAYLDCGDFQIASSSPEQFLHLSGSNIQTRPIKGTRPRSSDTTRDAQLAYELQTSPKELAELVMITDLLRNDLGKVCEYGSVRVPELAKLERYPQVQHLVSTVEGRLRNNVTHFAALASCFPGGSITGAPKIRAMEIIDELEPISRGPYCGCHGYLGFNRESQLSISIRTAVLREHTAFFHAGAGIVADSIPEAEHDETLAKAAGFLAALRLPAADGKLHISSR